MKNKYVSAIGCWFSLNNNTKSCNLSEYWLLVEKIFPGFFHQYNWNIVEIGVKHQNHPLTGIRYIVQEIGNMVYLTEIIRYIIDSILVCFFVFCFFCSGYNLRNENNTFHPIVHIIRKTTNSKQCVTKWNNEKQICKCHRVLV
jgi:hypothetical protein